MKVWCILYSSRYSDGDDLHSVYSTKEKADRVCKRYNDDLKKRKYQTSSYYVEDYEVDEFEGENETS